MRRSSETSPRRESASFRHEPKPCQAAVRTREVSSQGSYAQWPFPSPDEKHTRTSYKNEFEHFCDIVVLTNTLCTKGHPETLSNHNGTINAISQKCPWLPQKFSTLFQTPFNQFLNSGSNMRKPERFFKGCPSQNHNFRVCPKSSINEPESIS